MRKITDVKTAQMDVGAQVHYNKGDHMYTKRYYFVKTNDGKAYNVTRDSILEMLAEIGVTGVARITDVLLHKLRGHKFDDRHIDYDATE
jgi:hypothetical protein